MLTLLPWFTLAWTAELVTSRVTVADGLPTSWTTALAQGPDDRMWLGGPGWVARFDGERMRSWSSPGAAGIVVTDLVPLGDDTAAVRLLDGQVLQVSDDLLVPVVGPDGAPLAARDLSAGRDGSLLAVVDGRAWRRDGVGWSPSPGGVVDVEQVAEGRPGELFLGTSDGWHTARDGASTLLVATRDPVDAVVDGDVAWLSAGRPLRVWRVQHGEEPVLVYEDPFDRAYAMAPRDGSLWLSRSTDVVRIDGDGQATTYPGRQLQAHGPVLVDSAGGLWGASFEGALYVPEPGLERWTVESGLATNTTRGALKVGGDPWVPTWNGLHRIGPDGRVQVVPGELSKSLPCAGDDATVWVKVQGAWRAHGADGSVIRHAAQRAARTGNACHRSDGTTWLLDGDTLLRAGGAQEAPEPVASLPGASLGYERSITVTPSGWLWAGGLPRVCGTRVSALSADVEPTWTCHDLPGQWGIAGIYETRRGQLWVAQRDLGVLTPTSTGLQPVPGTEDLGIKDIRAIVASRRGGAWLMGLGPVLRVVDDADGARVVERLPDWIGRTLGSIVGATEEADGTLWLASDSGLVRVPRELRESTVSPPRPRLVGVSVDGARVLGSRVAADTSAQVVVDVTSVAFRAPNLVRYRHRLGSGPWSASTQASSLALSGLTPGVHELQIVASLDGQAWSEPVAIALTVTEPWWRRREVYAGLLIAVLAGLLLVQTLRERARRRAEDLRTRVAMDLHDELGAGLASIGLLAGLIARGAGERAQELAERIADDAQGLGTGLSGIVWSLRPGHDSAEALADYLAHRGQALLEGVAELVVERGPGLQRVQVDLDVLRAAQLLGLEALSNAARHAEPLVVILRIRRRGTQLELVVQDDGVGLPAAGRSLPPDRGLGLRSMARRMEEVGGQLALDSAPGKGTRVVATFPPRAHWWSRRRAGAHGRGRR